MLSERNSLESRKIKVISDEVNTMKLQQLENLCQRLTEIQPHNFCLSQRGHKDKSLMYTHAKHVMRTNLPL